MNHQTMNKRHHLIRQTVSEYIPLEYEKKKEEKSNDDIDILRSDVSKLKKDLMRNSDEISMVKDSVVQTSKRLDRVEVLTEIAEQRFDSLHKSLEDGFSSMKILL